MDTIRILEYKYAVDIIDAVAKNPGINKTAIIRMKKTGERTRCIRINQLIDAGIIEGERYLFNGYKLRLTKEGEKIYKAIKPLLKASSEESA